MSTACKIVLLALIVCQANADGAAKAAKAKPAATTNAAAAAAAMASSQQARNIAKQYNLAQPAAEQDVLASNSLETNVYAQPDIVQQYASGYPYGYGTFGPYADGSQGAFAVQSGYEGYIVPADQYYKQNKAVVAPPSTPNFLEAVSSFVPSLRSVTGIAGRFFSVLFGLLGVTVTGGGITFAICQFTPLCTLTIPLLGLGLGKAARADGPKATIADDLKAATADRVEDITGMFIQAVDKVKQLQETFANEAPAANEIASPIIPPK